MDISSLPILRNGHNKPEVRLVKSLLRSQGGWKGSDSTAFGPILTEAVRYFQTTHLGPNGKYLTGDGEVGPATWWALYNPTGDAQKSNITPPNANLPDGSFDFRYGRYSKERRAFLKAAFHEHSKGVKEIPDGSNQGGEVNKYIKGFGPAPWCALFVSWLFFLVMGRYPNGARQAHVQTGWRAAVAKKRIYKKGSRKPVPGDLAVWHFTKGQGHVSVVVAVSDDGEQINTLGGNEGNRVKLGLRVLDSEPNLVGFIDLFGDSEDAATKTQGGLMKKGESSTLNANTSR